MDKNIDPILTFGYILAHVFHKKEAISEVESAVRGTKQVVLGRSSSEFVPAENAKMAVPRSPELNYHLQSVCGSCGTGAFGVWIGCTG